MNIIVFLISIIFTFQIVCISSNVNQSIENDDDVNELFNSYNKINTTKDNEEYLFQMDVFKNSIKSIFKIFF